MRRTLFLADFRALAAVRYPLIMAGRFGGVVSAVGWRGDHRDSNNRSRCRQPGLTCLACVNRDLCA